MEHYHGASPHFNKNAQTLSKPCPCNVSVPRLSSKENSPIQFLDSCTSVYSSCSSINSNPNLGEIMELDRHSTNISNQPSLPPSTAHDFTSILNCRNPPTTTFSQFPYELILHIFKFLTSAQDLRSATLVCKIWCNCGMDILWSRPTLLSLTSAEQMVQTMASPKTTFHYPDFVRRLNLSLLGPELSDSILMHFASCFRLERLLLAGSVNVTLTGLNKILYSCPGLYSLDLTEIPAVTDELVESISSQCPRLHTLYLGSCSTITDESVIKLAAGCSQLKRIKLSQCALLTDRSILALTKQCPQLIEIDVASCSSVSNEAFQSVFESLPQIRDINMTQLVNITDAAFALIHHTTHRFEQLRVLNLTSCNLITDETLIRIIPAAPRLRSLALTKCDKITDMGAAVIRTLGKHLHYLHLGHCAKITDRLVALLAHHCSRIRYLDLACCSKLTDAAVFALAQLPKLRRVGLVKCSNITDHGIYAMLKSQTLQQTLERVHLSYCIQLSVSAVSSLVTKCTKLTHLSLTGVPAFNSSNYQKFCRAPPSEFTAHQREVFCVFSGKGVRDLRNFMNEHPVATPSQEDIQASYQMISSSVALMIAGTEAGLEEVEEDEEGDEELAIQQGGIGSLVAAAGAIELMNPIETTATDQIVPTGSFSHDISIGEVEAQVPGDVESTGMDESVMTSAAQTIGEPLVFRPTSLFHDNTNLSMFPNMYHSYCQQQGHRICSRHDGNGVVLCDTDMEVDSQGLGQSQELDIYDKFRNKIPSPGTLGRSLYREGEGSGAGSTSPDEREEDDEDF